MARFTIYSPNGVALYEGTPTFTGQYMKPGLLEFREVALPALVDFVPGCYVDYTRTGHRYRTYTVPQLKRQARSNSYGGAFVYQSVQLYDASKMLEYCPFRDLVTGDNRIHFSTQPSISTFEGCDGLARRFEACLQDQYGTNSWAVRIATQAENPNLYELMLEPREFTVSGMNILECLNKVYEIWPEVGWIYKVENGKDTIVIGGGGLNPNEETYAYGKGFGLTSLTRVAANADEIANRIFAYGSSRNMLPGWYNSQNIKDAESVDIQNLMIPVSEWGLTDGERDAAKAYVEDDDSIAKNGLRPVTVYFDGSGEYPEIYPTLRETTIGMVRIALGSSSAKYYPSTAIYTDPSARIDQLLSAQTAFDSGLAGNAPGKANVEMGDTPFSASGEFTMTAGLVYYPFYHYQGTWAPESAGIQTIAWKLDLSGHVALAVIEKVVVSMNVKDPSYQGPIILAKEYELAPDEAGVVTLSGQEMYAEKVNVRAVDYVVSVEVAVYMTAQETDETGTYTTSGNVGFALQNYRKKTFTISLRQLGFDINEQSAIGDGKTIAMRSGDCVGRSFAVKSVQYDSATDSWTLECWRSEDESLSQWFPNSDYKVKAGDEFVLIDIAMPDIYVSMAEQRLLQAAQDFLADMAFERWQYAPEIDAEYMVKNGCVINAGEVMTISDADIIGENTESVVVDTIIINEGESAIPTYKVTLRDRKKKTWTESESPETSSSKSVGSDSKLSQSASSSFGDSFFQLDESGNVTLKPKYQNLWVPGWMAAGGVGGGTAGGGGASYLNDLFDVTAPNPAKDDLLQWNGSTWVNVPQSSIVPTISVDVPSTGNALTGATMRDGTLFFTTGTFVNSVTVNQTISSGTEIGSISVNNGSAVKLYAPNLTRQLITNLIADGNTIPGLYVDRATNDANGNNITSTYATVTALDNLNIITGITTQQDCTVDFSWKNGNITKIDLNHDHTYYVAGTLAQHISSKTALLGVTGISNNSAWTPDNSQIIWEAGNNAWHFKGNLYADGWIAAGGIGDGAGGGGGTNSLYGLVEVLSTTNPSANHLFYFNGTKWTNTPVKTINGNSIVGSGDITISGGGGSTVSISNLLTSGTRVATITIDGTPYDIKAPSGGSGGSTVSWGDQSGNTIPLTVDGTTKSLLISETDPTVPSWAKASSKPSYTFSEISSKPTTISGYGITDAHITNEIVTLGSNTIKPVTIDTNQTITGAKTFTTKVVTIGSTSGISVNASSYIDIGPVRLKYENNAIHVTKASSSDTNEYGMYADGFVAAGGIGSSSLYEVASNKVTSLSSASTDTQYPSAKCVYDIVGNVESLLAAI